MQARGHRFDPGTLHGSTKASYLRIEERELEAGGVNQLSSRRATLCDIPL